MTSTDRRSMFGWILVPVLALIFGGLALSLASRGADRSRREISLNLPPAVTALPIPGQAILGSGEQFAANASSAGGPDIWSFSRAGDALRVQRWIVTQSLILPQTASLCSSPPRGRTLYAAVSSWPGVPQGALVLTAVQGDFLAVQVRRPVPPFTVLVHGRTPALSLSPGHVRSIFAGQDRRGYAELIVVDRPAKAGENMRIRVLSGATGFRSVARDVRQYGANSWPETAWNLTVGGVDSTANDLLFISREQPTRTGKTEIHALLSSRDYNGYGTQRPINNPESTGINWSYVLAHGSNNAPLLYGIDPGTRRLMRFSLRSTGT
jgi:hypothetical protein